MDSPRTGRSLGHEECVWGLDEEQTTGLCPEFGGRVGLCVWSNTMVLIVCIH
jgi:hypothetical protein